MSDNPSKPDTAADNSSDEEMVTGQDRRKRILRAGLFSIVGLLILVIGVFVIGEKQNLFSSTFMVSADFQTVGGLKSGALVTINGIKIGTVSNVDLRIAEKGGTFVHVEMIIDEEYHEFVRRNTQATVSQNGLIGEKLIELRTVNTNAPLATTNSRLPSVEPTDYTAIFDEAQAVVKNSQNITASLDTLFMRFRRGEGTLGKFLTDDAVYEGLARVTESTERLLNQTGTQLGAITGTLDRAASNVDDITLESRRLIADIANGKGTVGALLYDRSIYDSLEQVLGTLNRTADAAAFAAREFGINMRGLRGNWLVGGLFSGDETEATNIALQTREIELRLAELRRQKELLDQRERELMQIEGRSQ